MVHYYASVTNPDLFNNLAFFLPTWAAKETLPSMFAASSPEMTHARPRIRAEFERTLIENGLPERSAEAPEVRDIIDLAALAVIRCGAGNYDRLITRRGPPPFDDNGAFTRAFCTRVVGAFCSTFPNDCRRYSATAEFLNAGARTSGLDRHHIRRAFANYRDYVNATTRAGFIDAVGWRFMDATDALVLRVLLRRAKRLPGLTKLKGAALANALFEKYDFREQFEIASREPFLWTDGAA